MKKYLILLSLFSILPLTSLQAEESQNPSSKEISQGMAEVWCDKMLECSQDKSVGAKECRKTLFDNFKKGFDALPKERKINLPRPTYDECRENIKKTGCQELKQAQSLPACEFISLLGG